MTVRHPEVMPIGMELMGIYKKLPKLNTSNREGRFSSGEISGNFEYPQREVGRSRKRNQKKKRGD